MLSVATGRASGNTSGEPSCRYLGRHQVIQSPTDTNEVNPTLATAPSADPPPQLLVVDDDPVMIRVLARMLEGIGEVRFALSGTDAIRIARERVPDLILLDAELGDASGFDVCEELKSDPLFSDVAIIFVTSHRTQADELRGFAKGAADFIGKPVSEPLLRARASTQLRVQQLTTKLRRLSNTDALTGVANRHMFNQLLLKECLRAARGSPLALLMIDVDHFKGFNDAYGHPAGDLCLQSVARALTAACQRAGDVVARVGGEEFAILLPATTLEGATIVAQRVTSLVQELAVPHAHSSCAQVVTVSVGVAGHPESGGVGDASSRRAEGTIEVAQERTGDALLHAADLALYAAKQAGRNRAWMTDVSNAVPELVAVTATVRCAVGFEPRDRSFDASGAL